MFFFFFQAEDGIRDYKVTGVQTCALPIWQALFLFHISLQFLSICFLEGISIEKSKLRGGRLRFTFKNYEKCEMDVT